jgi:hypothetical protein
MERYKAKDKKARLKFVNVNRPDFKPENEGLDPKKNHRLHPWEERRWKNSLRRRCFCLDLESMRI